MSVKSPKHQDEEEMLRSVALKNAQSILRARQKAEQNLVEAKEALERKTRELAHSLSMMRATLESTTDGILVTGHDGKVTGFNEKYLQMWGLTRPAMVAANYRQLMEVTAGRLKDARYHLERVDEIYGASPLESFDLLELADGSVFERFSNTQFVDERNVGRVWTFRDITGRRRTEEALRDERHVLELLNRTGTAIASTLDLPKLVHSVTDATTKLSGARAGVFFYNTPGEDGDIDVVYALSDTAREDFKELGQALAAPLFGSSSQNAGPIRCEDAAGNCSCGNPHLHDGIPGIRFPLRSAMAVPVISRSGSRIGGLFFAHPDPGIFDERTERIVVAVTAQAAVAIDNARLYETAQRAAEERDRLIESERSARATAEKMSEMKDDFLANLSHELRTPLSAIVGWSQVLRQGVKSEAELTKGLDTIERNARMQTQLIDDLLDMTRITSGKVRLDIQPIAPGSFIEAAIETVRPAADAKGVRLTKLLHPEVAPIYGDPNRLQQVVWNLLSNAIKFTPKGGTVQVQMEQVDNHVEIRVLDTGIGIEPTFRPHVFERFRQEESSSTRKYGGLGLGLSIVKHLVELHGGTVSVESPGQDLGSTFSVHLPIGENQGEKNIEKQTHPGSEQLPADINIVNLSGIRVLVVDDEVDARDLLRRVLTDCNAEVFTASSAADALQIVERERPHVLVSDIAMPNIDGYELLRRVRALGAARGGKVPAIALTAFARSEDRTRALRAGFISHVSKPVELSELIASVATVSGRNNVQDS